MKTVVFTSPQTDENTYLCIDENTQKCVVIDPGAASSRVSDHLEKERLSLIGILLTHGHCDHIEGLDSLRSNAQALVAAHSAEARVLEDSSVNLSLYLTGRQLEVRADLFFQDQDQAQAMFRFGDTMFAVIHTPGHTPGGVCYYAEKDSILFTGDTLFYHSVGRTDLPLGEPDVLTCSIRDKLFTLPGHVKVYLGHGQPTDIAHEKRHNPYVGGDA